MQVTRSQYNRPKVLAIVALTMFALSCGWQNTMTFRSPSQRSSIKIWQTKLDNSWGTRVELVTQQLTATVFENWREAHVYFVHVYWSPDEKTVGVLATGANIWNIALDTATGKQISFEDIRSDFSESIRKTYNVPLDEKDPIAWAARNDAQRRFRAAHPEIKLTY